MAHIQRVLCFCHTAERQSPTLFDHRLIICTWNSHRTTIKDTGLKSSTPV